MVLTDISLSSVIFSLDLLLTLSVFGCPGRQHQKQKFACLLHLLLEEPVLNAFSNKPQSGNWMIFIDRAERALQRLIAEDYKAYEFLESNMRQNGQCTERRWQRKQFEWITIIMIATFKFEWISLQDSISTCLFVFKQNAFIAQF